MRRHQALHCHAEDKPQRRTMLCLSTHSYCSLLGV